MYKYKKRKNEVNINFRNAIENFNREEKVEFYLRIANHVENLANGVVKPPSKTEITPESLGGQCECRSFNLKIWKQKNIKMERESHELMV
jgi:hypothetical protein